MKIFDAFVDQLTAQLTPTATESRSHRSSRSAFSKASLSHDGKGVPHFFAKFAVCRQFSIGRIPGTIGAVMPALTQASLKRRKSSASKKNCVIASLAPASIFRLSQSISARAERARGAWGAPSGGKGPLRGEL